MPTAKVIIRGHVFDYEEKAPFVRSGYSVLGALEFDAEEGLVKCHECGDWFGSIGAHLKAHDPPILAAKYKIRHGLRSKTSICTPELRERKALKSAGNGKRLLAAIRTHGRKAPSRRGFGGKSSHQERRNVFGRCEAQITFRVQRLAAQLGRTPTGDELVANELTPSTLMSAFSVKSLNEAIEKIGLVPNPYTPKYGRDELIQILRDFKAGHGRFPFASECYGDIPTRKVFIRVFGSFELACEYAAERMPWPDEYLSGVTADIALRQRAVA